MLSTRIWCDWYVASVPERYVLLGLRLGRLRDGLVDGYFGPQQLADEAAAGVVPASEELLAEARSLRDDLAGAELEPQRRRWLAAQVEALVCVAELEAGEDVGWIETVRRCYGIDVGPTPEERFEEAHARLDAVLPGSGDLAGRLQRWNETQRVPPEKLLDAFEALTSELRRRSARLVDLPAGEGVEAELVSGKPWGAYNCYLGGLRSRIQINTDLPIHAHRPRRARRARGVSRPPHRARLQGGGASPWPGARRGIDSRHPHARVPRLGGNRAGRSRAGARRRLADGGRRDPEAARDRGRRRRRRPRRRRARRSSTMSPSTSPTSHASRAGARTSSPPTTAAGRSPRSASPASGFEFATHPFWSAYTPTYVVGPRLIGAYLDHHPDGLRDLLTEELTTADL